MNIFFLDVDPVVSAKSLCDKHVVKMVLETAQMCSTAIQKDYQLPPLPSTYKEAFAHHPMTKWVGESDDNMHWALTHGIAIGEEYTYRYEKVHKSQKVLEDIRDHYFPEWVLPHRWSDPPLCMPDDCKAGAGGYRLKYVDAYQKYYKIYKYPFSVYTKRDMPKWLKEHST